MLYYGNNTNWGDVLLTQTFMVGNLGLAGAIKLVTKLRLIQDKNIILDFGQMRRVRSIGMVYFVSAVEDLRRRGFSFFDIPDAPYWNNSDYHAVSYAGGNGFFDALGIDQGKPMGSYAGSQSYCPIVKITKKSLYEGQEEFQLGIENEAKRLAEVLTKDIPQATKTMQYLIREIMRNTFEHTVSEHLWIAAQRHPQEGKIEVGIADNAQGIRQVISVNPELKSKIIDDETALRYAIKPGVSGNAKYTNTTGFWANSGYGLYVTSQILSKLGSFDLISGTSHLNYSGEQLTFKAADYQGTAVRLEFDMNKIENLDPEMVRKVVKVGQHEALEDPEAVYVASKASQFLS